MKYLCSKGGKMLSILASAEQLHSERNYLTTIHGGKYEVPVPDLH
jgi:hypothetical protein